MISDGPSVTLLADFVNGFAFKSEHFEDEGLPVIRIKQLLDSNAEVDRTTLDVPDVRIDNGDIIFSWSASLAVRVWDRGPALLNQHLFRVDPKPGVHSGWLAYALMDAVERLEALMHGSAMTHITRDMLKLVTVALPSESEQRAIADFLDAETARIDALIEKKRRLATRLLERRASIMLRGVSGQLLNSGEIVDSGLPWIARRPKHWGEPLLKLVARLGSGHTPSRSRPEWWVDCTIPWITTGEVSQMREDRIEYIEETREKISELGMANSSAELHPADTVVLSRTASAGFSAIMGVDMATSQDFVIWTCGPLLDPRYLLLCLRAMRHDLLGRLAQGSTHQTIYMPDIESIRIPLPPLDEQHAVVNAVWRSLHKIDKIIYLLNHQIELLTEHRQALIAAAVTGQVEVSTTTTPHGPEFARKGL